jgi:hypothetical protein
MGEGARMVAPHSSPTMQSTQVRIAGAPLVLGGLRVPVGSSGGCWQSVAQ